MSHTPGPWAATHDKVSPEGSADNFSLMSGEEYILWGCGCCGSPVLMDADSNARLIASVPELLAALQRLAQAARDADLGYLDPATDHAFDVIARATGAA